MENGPSLDQEQQSLPATPEVPSGPFQDAQRQAFFARYQAQQSEARESQLRELAAQPGGQEKVEKIRRTMALSQNTLNSLGLAAGQTVGVVRSAGNMEGDWMVSEITELGNGNPAIELVKFPSNHRETGHVNKAVVPYGLLEYWQSDEAKRKYLSANPVQEPAANNTTQQEVIDDESNINSGETVLHESKFVVSSLSNILSRFRGSREEEVKRLRDKIARSQSVVGGLEEEKEILSGTVKSLRKGKAPSSGARPHSRRQQRAVGKASRHLAAAGRAKSERRRWQQVYGAEHDARHPLRPRPIDQDTVNPRGRSSRQTSDLDTDVQKERLSSGQYTRTEKRTEKRAARKSNRETKKYHRHMDKAEDIADRGLAAKIRNFRIKNQQRHLRHRQKLLAHKEGLAAAEQDKGNLTFLAAPQKAAAKWRRNRAVKRARGHIESALSHQPGTKKHDRAVKKAESSRSRAERMQTKIDEKFNTSG